MYLIIIFILLIVSRGYGFTLSLSPPLSSSTNSQGSFLFVTCQGGAEKIVKSEMLKAYPNLKAAFSRPGLITFKDSQQQITPFIEIKSKFARRYGKSIGSVATCDEILKIASSLPLQQGQKKIFLHVFPRDNGKMSRLHPQSIIEMKESIECLRSELITSDVGRDLFKLSERDEMKDGDDVFNIIVGEKDEKYFVGHHIHHHNKHIASAGGIFDIDLPVDAPSRAYLKVEEAIQYGNLHMKKGDVAVEIGSAPGGQAHSLLQRGLVVWGIDPSPPDREHADVVLKHPNFHLIKGRIESISHSKLPREADWLLCDANIPANDAIPHILTLSKRFSPKLKGLIYTCKLADELWMWPERLLDYLEQQQHKFTAASASDCHFESVTMTQLNSNRREVMILCLTKKGIAESQ